MRFRFKWRFWLTLILLTCCEPVEGGGIDQLNEFDGLTPRQKGVVLINELGCVSCHASSQSHFKPRRGPDLTGLGDRVNEPWLRDFLNAPHRNASGLSHPDFPAELEDVQDLSRPEVEEALTHYLLSQTSSDANHLNGTQGSNENGDALFHSTGCIACHGASSTEQGIAWIQSVRTKYQPNALHALLLDPLKTRPDARMPDMHLTHDEASDLSAFIMNGAESGPDQAFVSKPSEREKGQRLFGQLNCHACHDLDQHYEKTPLPGLETLRLDQGCLAEQRGAWPQFTLNEQQRSWIQLALQSESQWTPSEKIQLHLAQFNCFSCHQRDGIGGVTPNNDPYFTALDPNLGEQGRLPPALDGVGAKLNPVWMRKIIVQGAKSRPYMKTRMPRFGPGVLDELMELFATVDSKLPLPEIEMPGLNDTRRAGRDLAGTKGLACVTCHAFKGTKTGAMAAVDMSIMGQRLTREWFHHYLAEPQRFSPGTLMPDFWPEGYSSKPDIMDGNAQKQIEALWVYLSDGYSLGAPAGLYREPMRLVAKDQEAVMLRRSYPGVGKRGIGVGLPHGHNYVFNADKLGLAMFWKGEFADPAGVWMSQGHGRVRPLARRQISFPVQPQWQTLPTKTTAWPNIENRQSEQKFQGYRLDAQRVPTFLYEIDGALIEDAIKEIDSGSQWTLGRTLRIKKNGHTENLYFRVAVAEKIHALDQSQFQVGDELIITLIGDVEGYLVNGSDGDELRIEIGGNSNVKSIALNYQF